MDDGEIVRIAGEAFSAPDRVQRWTAERESTQLREDLTREPGAESYTFIMMEETGEYSVGAELVSGAPPMLVTQRKWGTGALASWESEINTGVRVQDVAAIGRSAAALVSGAVYDFLVANADLTDEEPLFDSTARGNDKTGALDATNLASVYAAMSIQRAASGQLLGIEPRFLIVPSALRVAAGKLNRDHGDLLTVIEAPELDVTSTTTWYLAARNSIARVFHPLLSRPSVRTRQHPEIDATELVASITFGVGCIDPRRIFRSQAA
jgi:hypothetical protein